MRAGRCADENLKVRKGHCQSLQVSSLRWCLEHHLVASPRSLSMLSANAGGELDVLPNFTSLTCRHRLRIRGDFHRLQQRKAPGTSTQRDLAEKRG